MITTAPLARPMTHTIRGSTEQRPNGLVERIRAHLRSIDVAISAAPRILKGGADRPRQSHYTQSGLGSYRGFAGQLGQP